jgi:pimeloyl-ACP methyl ester carboxylesterase
MTSQVFTLRDGRHIGVSVVGEPTATRLVFLCLPSPGAGGFDPDPTRTSRSSIRLVQIDRPGYGGSQLLPDDVPPSVERFADDIAEYFVAISDTARELSGLTFGRIGVVGWSFGGAIALALAARHPRLVDRVVIVGTPAPRRLDRGERYSPVLELRKHGVERSTASLADTLNDDGEPGLGSLGIRDDEADSEQFGLSNRIGHMLDAAWAQAADGMASDRIAARSTDWTSRLPEVEAPVLLVYGTEDDVAGASDAHWYERKLSSSRRLDVNGAGHLAISREWQRILEFLATPS